MSNKELLFYDEYERFYEMAEESRAFRDFCKAAFGEDFSQDGFSDINQINRILAKALEECGIPYMVEDITQETYELLKKKREMALLYEKDFEEEGNKEWFDLLMLQTNLQTT